MNLEEPDDAATTDSLQLHRSVLAKLKNDTVANYSTNAVRISWFGKNVQHVIDHNFGFKPV
jgi:hypothetical protein